MNTEKLLNILKHGVEDRLFSGFSVAVGRGNDVYFSEVFGDRSFYPEKLTLTRNTLFDIASMTKLVGTTMVALQLVDNGKLGLSAKIGEFFNTCHGREDITVFELMTHTSGLAAHLPLWKMNITPDEAIDAIFKSAPVCQRGERVVYSCMGYIVLGKLLERIVGKPLDNIIRQSVLDPLGLCDTMYNPPNDRLFASTEKDFQTDIYLSGVVHDENARFLGGVSGNAGLFSTLGDMMKFSALLSNRMNGFLSPKLFEYAILDHTPFCDESRGLGFHLYRDSTYPGGDCMSKGSYGHTGYTGTSLYVDSRTGVYVTLLTNRVHFGRNNNNFFTCRRSFYDAVFSQNGGVLK